MEAPPPPGPPAGVARTDVDPAEAAAAARGWWDAEAGAYLAEHRADLGDVALVWGPEGLAEQDAGLLGPVAGRRAVEVGCGAAQGARWLRSRGCDAVGVDVSAGMLAAARRLDAETGVPVPLVQADARALPLATSSVDLACSAYGALPFVADPRTVHREVARVLRPGGLWVFSVTHPVRWCLPDDPGPGGLRVTSSYFDRTPYVELDAAGRATYSEHHRTVGDHVRDVVAAGFRLVDLVEPEWPAGRTTTWGGWSPLRGRLVPGTAVFRCELPAA
ncbi:class I SAM-dependent methyltransferase [Vallicoccus soli]|uniref:SAM-dependent methyltransferase n=1 Tax=Vallicoccus soli TaxID=2339232 RepID=A0A3A3YQT4_9ACTN|nr:class I SAM-dependent methyltransferase [Vallicoccus soli]RJK93736.1 SAM-dependent methyltransferase [Vallicoccus soli]